jgi:transposase
MDGARNVRRRGGGPSQNPELPVGARAAAGKLRLRSFQIGAVPLVNHYFQRLRLAELLRQHLPEDDVRQTIPTERIVLLLVRNVLLSREPMYAIPEWVARHAPDLFDLYHADVETLQDDRLGACLARLFQASTPQFLLAIVRAALDEFDVSLDELHNDSTSVAFHGQYAAARKPVRKKGRLQPAITWGHSKDHRPDLKQLLFTLTLTEDGGVPLYFHVDCGNTTDDSTHRRSWDLLVELAGGPDFLYVADCKLASRENLNHLAARGGRFLTVLPGTRGEDANFRERLRREPASVVWETCWIRVDEPDDPLRRAKSAQDPNDVLRVCTQEEVTADGYRLLWFHSHRKAQLDQAARGERCQRAIQELQELQARLTSPRTRFHQRAAVERAVEEILTGRNVESLLCVEIQQRQEERFRKQGPGRPSRDSKYHREVIERFEITWRIDHESWQRAQADDGVFPLLTNDRRLTPRELLEAYKRQPKIEKRFSQLKSDFDLAPVFLKSPERVVGLFTIYFLALLVQALIERDLRRALEKAAAQASPGQRRWEGSVEVYPEGRRTRRPTARHVLDQLEHLRRYDILLPTQLCRSPKWPRVCSTQWTQCHYLERRSEFLSKYRFESLSIVEASVIARSRRIAERLVIGSVAGGSAPDSCRQRIKNLVLRLAAFASVR